MKKITNKNINNPINHFSQGNINATREKHIANLIRENLLNCHAQKNYSNQFNSELKKDIKFTFDNIESYNQPFTLIELQNSIFKSNNSGPPVQIKSIITSSKNSQQYL